MNNYSSTVEKSTQTKKQSDISSKANAAHDEIKNIITHHLSSFQDHDIDAVVSDYVAESVLITRDAIYTGPEEIRPFFVELVKHFPKEKSTFNLDKFVVQDGLAFIVWHGQTPSLVVALGTDTFVLKDGKILQQTFVGDLKFI